MNEENDLQQTAEPGPEAAASETVEKLRTENEQLKAAVRLGEARRKITAELAAAGAVSPDLLFSAVAAELQFAEDGAPLNVAALVRRLKTEHPEQFGRDGATRSIDAGSAVSPERPLSRELLAKMKPAEIAKLDWDEVKSILTD